MFPIPIQKRPLINRISYKILVPVTLFIWLIPLIGIMLTSIRGLGDITAGNYWGMPSEFLSDEPTTPRPINVIVTGDPTIFINSLTNFEAFGPELIHPPPI